MDHLRARPQSLAGAHQGCVGGTPLGLLRVTDRVAQRESPKANPQEPHQCSPSGPPEEPQRSPRGALRAGHWSPLGALAEALRCTGGVNRRVEVSQEGTGGVLRKSLYEIPSQSFPQFYIQGSPQDSPQGIHRSPSGIKWSASLRRLLRSPWQ